MKIYGYNAYGGPEVAEFLDVDHPRPRPGEIKIKVHALSVNPGDISIRSGKSRDVPDHPFGAVFPMALGREAAGTVVELGAGVSSFAVGDLVFGTSAPGCGACGDYATLVADGSAHVPEGLSAAEASCIPVAYGTALDVLDQLNLKRGDTIVVVGAGGGVGTAVLTLARARGVAVMGVASESKREIVEKLGGIHVAKGDGWEQRVKAIGRAPQGLLDLVGGQVLREATMLIDGPSIISIADPVLAAEFGGSGVVRRRTTEAFNVVAQQLVEAGGPLISRRFGFMESAQAVAEVEGGHAAGKVVIEFQ